MDLSTFRARHAGLISDLYSRSGASRWSLPESSFADALRRAAASRHRDEDPTDSVLRRYLESLHLEDLALARACAEALGPAWDEFVARFRPELYAAARAVAGEERGRELADNLYAELYGVTGGDERRSLFAYFHGRSKLSTWLRSVLAQRHVDRWRDEQRRESLDDVPGREAAAAAPEPDPDRQRLVAALERSFAAALSGLPPRDRLRLSAYYVQQLTLAQIGRLVGEHESSVSRNIDRARRDIRARVDRLLGETERLRPAEIAQCYEYALEDWGLDLSRVLKP